MAEASIGADYRPLMISIQRSGGRPTRLRPFTKETSLSAATASSTAAPSPSFGAEPGQSPGQGRGFRRRIPVCGNASVGRDVRLGPGGIADGAAALRLRLGHGSLKLPVLRRVGATAGRPRRARRPRRRQLGAAVNRDGGAPPGTGTVTDRAAGGGFGPVASQLVVLQSDDGRCVGRTRSRPSSTPSC